jgi:transposase
MQQVIIGVDPHKLSVTIEVVDRHEQLLGSGRFGTDKAGYTAMRSYVKAWPDRVWAVEGCQRCRPTVGTAVGRGRRADC